MEADGAVHHHVRDTDDVEVPVGKQQEDSHSTKPLYVVHPLHYR